MNRFILSLAASILALGAVAPARGQELPALLKSGIASFQSGYDDWDRTQFVAAARSFAAARGSFPTSSLACYWEGVAELHAALWCRDPPAAPEASWLSGHLSRAAEAFEEAIRRNPADGESRMLLATALGIEIQRNPVSMLWRGRRVLACERRALELAPDNPRVHYLIGSGEFEAPGARGAKDRGLGRFLRAAALFEAERSQARDPLLPAWGFSSCLTFQGRIRADAGDRVRAAACFRRALEVNPRDRLARRELDRLLQPLFRRDQEN